jgi:hypothetical protein
MSGKVMSWQYEKLKDKGMSKSRAATAAVLASLSREIS